jgi:hypothetical protein
MEKFKMARNKTEKIETVVEPVADATPEKKIRKPREPRDAKFVKAGNLIMNAINDGAINSESDIVTLINKAFMTSANRDKVQERIATLEAKLEAMKKASVA